MGWPGVYFPGDGAKIDRDMYLWILGRIDNEINTAGQRISIMEVESMLAAHLDVLSGIKSRYDED